MGIYEKNSAFCYSIETQKITKKITLFTDNEYQLSVKWNLFSSSKIDALSPLTAIGHYNGHCEKSPYLPHGHYNGHCEKSPYLPHGHYNGHCEKSPYLPHGHYNGHNVHFSLLCFSKV